MKKIGLVILGIIVAAAVIHFWGITASTLVLFVIGAFTAGYFLGRRRRVVK
jgi:hypothetical protein